MRGLIRIFWRGGRLALALFVCSVSAGEAQAQSWYAAECQQWYQNGWAASLPHTWTRCQRFIDELAQTDLFYYGYTLEGGKARWEDTLDHAYIDDVDLLYAATHGGATTYGDSGPYRSGWAMYEYNTFALSNAMRLGDESWQLSILATYACETLKYDDGLLWTRMGPIFRGGLKMAMGSPGDVWSGDETKNVGRDFADGLQKNKWLKYAWRDANAGGDYDQDLMVMTTGANQSECHDRRATMTWGNYRMYPRRRDGQIGWLCWSKWLNY